MARASQRARREELPTDEGLLREASLLLRKRLGVSGYLRWLRLTHGGRDNFQELRREWEKAPLDEVLQELAEE